MSLVLFDIDGTLLRGAGPHHKNALIDGVRRATGLSTSFEGIDTAGQLDRDLIVALLRAGGMNEQEIPSVLAEILIECRQCYGANCAADLSAFVCKGAREALVELRARGAVLALVTGNLSDIGWRKMELAGLRDFFSLGSFSEDGATRAELARMAAYRARDQKLVAADCRVSLIGDHANDIQAARVNGFQAVAVASGVMSAAELAGFAPDILLDNLSELDCRAIMSS
jgi:phosphoglycolate phosphatase-like HAD superfamily hydrolase